jgi:Lon protease-like protein
MLNRNKIPIFPLQAVLFPGMSIQLNIFEARYLQLIEACLRDRSPFGVLLILEGSEVENGEEPPRIAQVGCLARITRSEKLDDGRFTVDVRGGQRFRIEELSNSEPYLTAKITLLGEDAFFGEEVERLRESVSDRFRSHIASSLARYNRTVSTIHLPGDPTALSFAIAAAIDISLGDKQQLLEATTTRIRLEMEGKILSALTEQPHAGASIEQEQQLSDPNKIPSKLEGAQKVTVESIRPLLVLN